ncbi:uncharacterized protein [Dermacentor andersoni]|uniref:uncharacterized protein isoform X2 n=1 Tax=Dermacentor andersoni TaxID=34620 RepID=UPI0024179627|nr:uncharacterized protein LOC126543138 isoform X2 [Dermacentor andersoni]
MNICVALSFLIFVELCDSSRPKAYDDRCKIILYASSSECPRQRWFYDWKNKFCLPSCSATAPFSSKIECQGICRSGKQDIKTPEVRNAQGTGQPSYFDILQGEQDPTASMIPILKIQIRHAPPTRDMRCRMHVADTLLNKCHHRRWYYNEIQRVCQPTCSEEAPFLNKMVCDGVCRTVDVCGFPVASFPCFHEAHPVFIYNPNDKSCFKSYSCSYFGNKFPTLEECRRTCKKCAANDQSRSRTASSSQGNGQILSFASSAGNQITPSSAGLSTGKLLANPYTPFDSQEKPVAQATGGR